VTFFDKRAADALAREVQNLIDRKVIDSRSPAADALLDYVDPGPNESVPGKLAASFTVGQQVQKHTGDYQLDGEVRAVFTTRRGTTRYVVEHAPGFLHIYSETNLRAV
jgi:hypothetical protein